MPRNPLPDFVIIGTQRGGTTSLFRYLAGHPHVEPPLEKELHFFDLDYSNGVEWYRSQFGAARATRPWRRRPRTGEATPYYLFHPLAPARIASVHPRAKLIALLRNPVERAYSHWAFVRAEGHEPLSFEEALRAEPERLAGEEERIRRDETYFSFPHQYHSYLSRGRYAEQLRRWFSVFARDQLLVLRSEDLFERPGATFGEVLRFLHLRAWAPPAFERYNPSVMSRIDRSTRARLEEHFRPLTADLSQLLGREMVWDG